MRQVVIKIVDRKSIRPMVVRLGLELWEDNYIKGEYQLPIDLEQYVTYPEEENGRVEFDVARMQQDITNSIASMQVANDIALGLRDLSWTVNINEESSNSTQPDDTEV